MITQPQHNPSADPATPLPAGELALARSYTYTIASRLLLHGLTPALAPAVAVIPELAATVTADVDPDQAAATQQALLGFALFPYQSSFLDPSGLLGGEESVRVQHTYAQCGFTPATSAESPDHIGHELACLACLCAAESDAWADQRSTIARRVQRLQADFLQKHLLRWLPSFALALQRQQHPFYAALAELTLALVDNHQADVSGAVPSSLLPLPPAPPLLDTHATTLQDIAHWLLCPPYSGLFLSRDDLGRLARRYQLPRGFGERALLLTNLLRAAITYGCFPAVIDDLAALVSAEVQAYRRLAQTMPALVPFVSVWQTQLATTTTLLVRINALAAAEVTRLQEMEST